MTGLEKYISNVLSDKIVACQKIHVLCEYLKAEIAKGRKDKKYRWVYDEKAANRAVEFIEKFCYIPSGRIGQPFKLELYEKAIVQATFGFVDRETGLRRFTEVLVIVARKNGKTSLAAAMELYMLVADGEGAPQIYNIATTGNQANIAFNACVRMVRQSRAFKGKIRKRVNDLYFQHNLGFIQPLSGNANALDGLDVHMGVLDEIHAMKTRELYDVVKQGMSARSQPLLFQITTAGFTRYAIYDEQYDRAERWLDKKIEDDRFIAFVYELDDVDEWDKERMWEKANPGLGTVKKLSTLREHVEQAKVDPSFLPTVLTKDFNLPQNQATAWLTFSEAVNEETYDIKDMGFRYGIAGFDASDTVDLSAAKMLCMRPGDDKIYERSMYWLPESVIESWGDVGKDRDDVPYRQWIARGLLRTVPGNKVEKRVFLDWLLELKDEEDLYTYAVGYDPWHFDDTTVANLKSLVGESRVFPVRQGAITLSQPMKQMRADFAANRIVDNHNPINEWCRMNVSIKVDANGNIQPFKKELSAKNRIDGFAAELDAYVVLNNLFDDYQQVI